MAQVKTLTYPFVSLRSFVEVMYSPRQLSLLLSDYHCFKPHP